MAGRGRPAPVGLSLYSRAAQYTGNDVPVPVSVRGEASVRLDAIIVNDAQRAETVMLELD